ERWGVSGRLMGLMGGPLARKVPRRVAGIIRSSARGLILPLEPLERGPRLYQGAVHGEVFVREQLERARLCQHSAEKLSRYFMLEQPRAIGTKAGMVEA